MQCPQCQHENREGRRFCAECGTPLSLSCNACAFVNEPGEKFCGGCGIPLAGQPSAPSPAQTGQRQPDAESRFHAILPVLSGLLQREGRITYRELKHIFGLDDALLDEIREALTLKRLAVDEAGKVLVWTGETPLAAQPAVSTPSRSATVETTVIPSPTVSTSPLVSETPTPSNGPTVPIEATSTDVSEDDSTTSSGTARV